MNLRLFEYNSCGYNPIGWGAMCRFVVMSISKEKAKKPGQTIQCALFEDERYLYRISYINLDGRPNIIIAEYDKRAD